MWDDWKANTHYGPTGGLGTGQYADKCKVTFFASTIVQTAAVFFLDQAQPGCLLASTKYIVSDGEVDFLSTLTSGVPSQ